MKGFTLIEVLITIFLITIIMGLSSYFYNKIYQSDFLVEETANYLINILNLARQKSILGEGNNNWGVWLINNQKNPDAAHLFQGTSENIKQSFLLPNEIDFIDPPINSSKTINFQKLTGDTNSTTIQLGFQNRITTTIVIPISGSPYIKKE